LRDDRQPRLDFALALRSRVDDWARMAHVRTQVDIATNDDVFQPARDELLRIVDEALANVLRHSGATEVRIRFARESQRLVLRIGDDGHGVPAAASEGMGLGNMRSRAQSLRDGDFHIDSAPGTGVTITVSFRQDPETFA
jgi:signal transduction histidine kinase